jgi:2-oxoglutarate/2-oxoacid ferredoxin oxidoreductase subunit alpha
MPKLLLQGNQAIAYGAQKAGLSFFAGYPITPASEIMHCLARTEVKVEQMEDEIASIFAVIGASLGGAKAMTETSGPGFSLMQEGIGYAHMVEVPLVIVNVQRVGPSTGMPTMAAQGDILQTRWGTHGDFFPLVFYPNSVSELYKYTMEAFNASEESSSPVVLLSDEALSHLYETIELEEPEIKERRQAPLGSGTRHFTGLTSRDSIPSTTSPQIHTELIFRLKKKQENTAKKYCYYTYLENKNASTLLISYGVISRLMYQFKDRYSLIRPIRMFPVIEEMKDISAKYEDIIVVEMNAGQYVNEVERLINRNVKFILVLGRKLDIVGLKESLDELFKKKYLKDSHLPTTWCGGCGNGLVLKTLSQAFDALGMPPQNIVIVSGIGCAGRSAGYFLLDTVHAAHGRVIPIAEGIKAVKAEMKVVVLSGDGDLLGIGGNHLLHATRRDSNITVICINNEIYGMTGGQRGPTTKTGISTISTPKGNQEQPINIQALIKAHKCFYARSTTFHLHHLKKSIISALKHEGFAFVDAKNQCITNYGRRIGFKSPYEMLLHFRDTYKIKEGVEMLEEEEIGITL